MASNDNQIDVSFDMPASDGGSPITGYRVNCFPPDVAPVEGNASPITVTGLTNGVNYTFTVEALNAVGNSAPSAASNSTTP